MGSEMCIRDRSYIETIPFSENNVDNKDFCSIHEPTHVITSVNYGIKVFLVVEKDVEKGEDHKAVSAWLKSAISAEFAQFTGEVKTTYNKDYKYSKESLRIQGFGNSLVKAPDNIEGID